jgi:small ligand-binding sensory domain FIST
MRCASALSTARDTAGAVREVLEAAGRELDGGTADLAVAFASPHHAEGLAALADECAGRALARHVLGCTGESIVGDGVEVEGDPALALWLATFPEGTSLTPVRLTFDAGRVSGWPAGRSADDDARGLMLLLADPFTFPADAWLVAMRDDHPRLRVVGGMASGGGRPGVNRLALDQDVYEQGAVGLILDGPAEVRTVVSQGCRPIGRPLLVTKTDRNVVKELGRRPAMEVFRAIYAELDAEDQARVRNGLHLGRVINEYQESFELGDFLIRNVLGADAESGIALTDVLRVGQTVQFHVRDASTADEELRSLLAREADRPVAGALVFTCNGRGTRLFPTPHHDALAIREALGPVPTAGFFAMGEIGPVQGQNFLHGFTASIALFGDRPR